jgi:uncharacterized protein (DUF1330 family)
VSGAPEYKAKVAPSILAAGGKYLVRGRDVEVLEGEPPAGRTVVLSFPTRQDAIDWYRSDEYTEIRKTREGAARARCTSLTASPERVRSRQICVFNAHLNSATRRSVT